MATPMELAAAKLRAEAEAAGGADPVVAQPAEPPQPPMTDAELKARVQSRFQNVVSKMGAPLPELDLDSALTGVSDVSNARRAEEKTAENAGQPSEAAKLSDKAHNDIGTAGGDIQEGPLLRAPQIVTTKGGMIPNAERGSTEYDAAPKFAQEEFRQMGKEVNQARFGAETEASKAAKENSDQQATIQGQIRDYEDEAHRQQLEVVARQEALTQRHEELMGNLEKEISNIPNAPLTIREKLDQSGIGDKIAFGFAAALSVLGSGRNGGESAQRFIGNVNQSINQLVLKEKDEYERMGDKVKRADNVYEAAYKAMGDKAAALEVTRKLYMEAADASLKEQAARYQGALVGPNLQKAMAEWEQSRADANLKAAGTIKQVAEKTMKYVPPSSTVVYDPRDPRAFMKSMKPKDFETVEQYRKYLDENGHPQVEKSIKALESAIRIMPEGFNLGLFINGKMPTSSLNTALSAFDSDKQRAIKQQLQTASNALSREANGQSKTANEIILSSIETGLHNRAGAIQTLQNLKSRASETKHRADTTFRLSNGASAGEAYKALEMATPRE